MNYRKTAQVDATESQGPQSLCAQRVHGLHPETAPFLPELVGSVDGHSAHSEQSGTEG